MKSNLFPKRTQPRRSAQRERVAAAVANMQFLSTITAAMIVAASLRESRTPSPATRRATDERATQTARAALAVFNADDASTCTFPDMPNARDYPRRSDAP